VKEAIDQLDKAPNSADAQKAISILWSVADGLATRSVSHAGVGQPQLANAEARWSVDHTDAVERLKQAWRTAEAA
jgi:23S rRNA A2030 N6-methylase RlmJ